MPDDIDHDTSGSGRRVKLGLAVFAAIGAFFLLAEHRAHVLPLLPWLLLAACPLMHLFMHGGHGRGHGHPHRSDHADKWPGGSASAGAPDGAGATHRRDEPVHEDRP